MRPERVWGEGEGVMVRTINDALEGLGGRTFAHNKRVQWHFQPNGKVICWIVGKMPVICEWGVIGNSKS